METDEIKKIDPIKRIADMCLKTLKPVGDTSGLYTAEIRVSDYIQLGLIIRDLMKLCIVAVDQDAAEIPSTIKSQSIDVGLILGIALQLFPIDEFELLNEISYLYGIDPQNEQGNRGEE